MHTNNITDEKLESLGQYIRMTWVNEYRDFELRTIGKSSGWGQKHMTVWDGGEAGDGKHHNPVWPKIARFAIEHDLDPEILVHALFWRKVDFSPKPNQAHGPAALEQYRHYMSPSSRLEIKNEILHCFESQKQRAICDVHAKTKYHKLDETLAWRITIGSSTVLTPLFSYCVARNQGWEDIADTYRARAMKQYKRFADIYNEVWGDWIPEDLKKEVKK